jgi:hypothetical protein
VRREIRRFVRRLRVLSMLAGFVGAST